jgi:hypothetical protein
MLRLVQRKDRQNTVTVSEYAEEKDMGLRDAAVKIAKERIPKASHRRKKPESQTL